jgi:hypothetical protein
MAEYAMVTAAVAFLAIALVGAAGQAPAQLPRSTAAALSLVASSAKAKKVSTADARTAYRRAPYAKPALKYVYAVGWISGTHDRAQCLYTVSTSDAVKEATGEIAHNKKVAAKLRRQGLTAHQAGTALVKGIQTACS